MQSTAIDPASEAAAAKACSALLGPQMEGEGLPFTLPSSSPPQMLMTQASVLVMSPLLLKMRPRGFVYRDSPSHTCLRIVGICINVPLHDLPMTHPSRSSKMLLGLSSGRS